MTTKKISSDFDPMVVIFIIIFMASMVVVGSALFDALHNASEGTALDRTVQDIDALEQQYKASQPDANSAVYAPTDQLIAYDTQKVLEKSSLFKYIEITVSGEGTNAIYGLKYQKDDQTSPQYMTSETQESYTTGHYTSNVWSKNKPDNFPTGNTVNITEPVPQPSQDTPTEPEPSAPAQEPTSTGIFWEKIALPLGFTLSIIVVIFIVCLLYPKIASHRKAKKQWEGIKSKARENLAEWKTLSTSIDDILRYPLVTDYSDTQVQELTQMVEEMRARLKDKSFPKEYAKNLLDSPLAQQEIKFPIKLAALLTRAEREKREFFTAKEHKDLYLAEQLLKTVRDEASSPNERRMAYKRVQKIMKDLDIHLSSQVLSHLELENTPLKEITA